MWPDANVPRTTTVIPWGLGTQAPGHAGSCFRWFVRNNTQNVSSILCSQWGCPVSSLMSCETGWVQWPKTKGLKPQHWVHTRRKHSTRQSSWNSPRAALVMSSQLRCFLITDTSSHLPSHHCSHPDLHLWHQTWSGHFSGLLILH